MSRESLKSPGHRDGSWSRRTPAPARRTTQSAQGEHNVDQRRERRDGGPTGGSVRSTRRNTTPARYAANPELNRRRQLQRIARTTNKRQHTRPPDKVWSRRTPAPARSTTAVRTRRPSRRSAEYADGGHRQAASRQKHESKPTPARTPEIWSFHRAANYKRHRPQTISERSPGQPPRS